MEKKVILHLCADTGSDSYPYQLDRSYKVIKVGSDIGVENFSCKEAVYGVIANPVCTEFSTAAGFHKTGDIESGMFLVNHCLRIIRECGPAFWALENPYNGRLKEELGEPVFTYQPWQYGSPWTKKTALWGVFEAPPPLYTCWEDVPKLDLYIRPGRRKPSLAFLHKSAIFDIPEFEPFIPFVNSDAEFRSLCSQGFAEQFYIFNQ